MVYATVLHFDFDYEGILCYCCRASVTISFPLHTVAKLYIFPHNVSLEMLPKLNGDTSSNASQYSFPPTR